MNILITGVAGGMGLATAKEFILEGHKVYGLDINPPKEELENFTFIKCDLTKESDVKEAFNIVKNNTFFTF